MSDSVVERQTQMDDIPVIQRQAGSDPPTNIHSLDPTGEGQESGGQGQIESYEESTSYGTTTNTYTASSDRAVS
jgi:hypothetical protein